jgi:hypothetical protein
MSRIITLFLAVLTTSAAVLSSEAKAQQTNFRQVLPPGNQNLMALDAAVQKGDTKGALALMQGNRATFNTQQAAAFAAINGVPGKPADINYAIDAANKAEQHILDGSNVKFAHAAGGKITATVTMATGGQPQTIPLTVDQFKQFLNVGINHWDRLMNQTVPATLQQIASGRSAIVNAGPQAPAGKTASSAGNTGGDEDDQTGKFDKNGHYIGKPVKSWSDQQAEGDQNGFGVELEKRSRAIYPDIGHEAERQQWMAAQKQRAIANDINRTKPLIYPVNGR